MVESPAGSGFEGWRVSVPHVPEFVLDAGAQPNACYKENNTVPDIEPWTTQVFVMMLNQAPQFLDIGANVGWYSLIASSVTGGHAHVHAFEPEPTNFKTLQENIQRNEFSNITAWPIALGDSDVKMELFLSEENMGDHRLSPIYGRRSVEVDVFRLDTVMRNIEFVPDIVKIDVQGAEVLVLDGAREVFRRAGDKLAIIIEFAPECLGMNNARTLVERLAEFGRPMFDLYPYDGGMLRPLSKDALLKSLDGCLNPKFDSHIDILVAPNDDRFENIRQLIGADFWEWHVD